MLEINKNFDFTSVTSTIAIFDPEVLAVHVEDDYTEWWNFDEDMLLDEDEALVDLFEGKCSIINVFQANYFQIRITSGDLTEAEKNHIYQTEQSICDNTGFEVKSGKIFIGCASVVPQHNDPAALDPQQIKALKQDFGPDYAGEYIVFPNGLYHVTVYGIDNMEDESLPNIVLVVKDRLKPFVFDKQESRLELSDF